MTKFKIYAGLKRPYARERFTAIMNLMILLL